MVSLSQAKEVSKFLVDRCDPVAIVLFGSVAVHGKGEDIDLLMAVEDSARTPRALESEVRLSLKPYYAKFAIDPIVLPVGLLQEHWRKGSPFLRLIRREGRSLYMKDSVRQWLEQAREDIATANYLLEGGFHRAACYHSQQSLDKAIKGVLIQSGWELEKTHSIERLLAIAEQYGVGVEITDEDAVFMESVYRGRHPAGEGLLPTGDPTAEDAERAIQIAEKAIPACQHV